MTTLTTVATTKITKTSRIFDWIIEDFELICPSGNKDFDLLCSPTFHVQHEDGSKSSWCVDLSGQKEKVCMYLRCKKTLPEELRDEGIRVNFTFSIGNDSRPNLHKREGCNTFSSINKCWGWPEFFPLATIHSRRSDYLQHGKLRSRLVLTILDDSTNTTTSVSTTSPKSGIGSQARVLPYVETDEFLETLLNDPEFSDVTLFCGSEEIKAHKAVLACRSEVFRKMFTTDMNEATSGVVQVDDLDHDTLKCILRYAYTGKINEVEPEMMLSVIYGAEKYGVDELKIYCFEKLVECITDENVGALAVAAHTYKAPPEVVESIHNYLDRGFLKKVRTDPGFLQLVKQYKDAFFSMEL